MDIRGLGISTVLHKLGAGRYQAGEPINHSVGAELLVELGQQIQKGEQEAVCVYVCLHLHHTLYPQSHQHYS